MSAEMQIGNDTEYLRPRCTEIRLPRTTIAALQTLDDYKSPGDAVKAATFFFLGIGTGSISAYYVVSWLLRRFDAIFLDRLQRDLLGKLQSVYPEMYDCDLDDKDVFDDAGG